MRTRFLILLAGCLSIVQGSAATDPNPTNLLIGVVTARLQVPPSTVRIRYRFWNSALAGDRSYMVDFDGEKRRFVAESPSRERSVYDGARVITYNPAITGSAEIRDIGRKSPSTLCDPRLLGLNPHSFWHVTIQHILPYEQASKIELLRQETISGTRTWLVHVTWGNPVVNGVGLWVDDKFRVHRFRYNTTDTSCFYEDKSYPWLPSRVLTKNLRGDKVVSVAEYSLSNGRANVHLAPNTWTIDALSLPLGTEVNDLRVHRCLGYWNGHGIGEDPFPHPDPYLGRTATRVLMGVAVLALIGVPLIWLLRLKAKGKGNVC